MSLGNLQRRRRRRLVKSLGLDTRWWKTGVRMYVFLLVVAEKLWKLISSSTCANFVTYVCVDFRTWDVMYVCRRTKSIAVFTSTERLSDPHDWIVVVTTVP